MWSLAVMPSSMGFWGHVGLWIRAPPLGHREPQSPLRKKSKNAFQHHPTSPILTPNPSPHDPRPSTSPCHPTFPHPQVPPLPHTLPSPAQHSAPAACGPYPQCSHITFTHICVAQEVLQLHIPLQQQLPLPQYYLVVWVLEGEGGEEGPRLAIGVLE